MRRSAPRAPLVQTLTLSVALHLAVLLIFGSVSLYKYLTPPPTTDFVAPVLLEPERPKQYKVELKQLQKRSSQPRAKSLIVTQVDVPVPKVVVQPNSPLVKHGAPGRGGGEGISFGSGRGTGLGLGTSTFFGLKAEAVRLAYIVDFSKSMNGAREKMMREELARSIDALPPGTEVAVIFFSGPCFLAGDDPTKLGQTWAQVKTPKSGVPGWRPKDDGDMPRARWLDANDKVKRRLVRAVKDTPLTFGTDWYPPFEVAFNLKPPPDAIYFMTDGAPQVRNEDEVVDFVKRKARRKDKKTTVHTIAMGAPRVEQYMVAIAKGTGGEYKILREGEIRGNRKKNNPAPKGATGKDPDKGSKDDEGSGKKGTGRQAGTAAGPGLPAGTADAA